MPFDNAQVGADTPVPAPQIVRCRRPEQYRDGLGQSDEGRVPRQIVRHSLAKAALLAAGLGVLGGCSQPPNSVVARDPLGAPDPTTRISCQTTPPLVFNTRVSGCEPIEQGRPIERRTVVRVKG